MQKLSIKKMKTHAEVWGKYLKDPEFKRISEELEFEFKLMDVIMEQRIKQGLTQKALAEKMGTKQSAIARFESGNYNPSLSFLKKLAQALGVTLTIKI